MPNLAHAAVKTCPVFDGKVASIDRSSIEGMPGVIGVVEVPNGVAVAAESWWQAKRAMEALRVVWDYGSNAGISSATLDEQYKQAMATEGWLGVHAAGGPDGLWPNAPDEPFG